MFRRLFLVLIALALVAALNSAARAERPNGEAAPRGRGEARRVLVIPAGTVFEGDWFAAADVVEISGTVTGDAYVLAGKVIVDGRVDGDLLASGATVRVQGSVGHDARMAGGQVIFSGEAKGNLTAVGGSVQLTRASKVGGGVVAVGGDIGLSGDVAGDIHAAGGSLVVSGRTGGGLKAAVPDIRLTSRAVVSGDLTYWSEHEAEIEKGAVVSGKVSPRGAWELSPYGAHRPHGFFSGARVVLRVLSLLSTLVAGLVLIYLFPNFNRSAVAALKARPWASLGVGVAFLLVVPAAAMVMALTVVGIPLGLILLAAYFISLYLAKIFVIFWAGSTLIWMLGGKKDQVARPFLAFVVGLLAYAILTSIPFFGALVVVFTLLFGLGSALIAEKEFYYSAGQGE